MFVGEAPGKNEAATGRPFCGASGKVLDKLLSSAGMNREDVYVTNIVKDRPPMNRDPLPEEIEIYGPFLERQIDIIEPKVIATLGRFSMDYIIRKFGSLSDLDSISRLHGRILDGETAYGKLKIIPLYHPAVAIYNRNTYADLEKDFQLLKDFNR
jgi:DNA polymerase